MRFTSQEYCDMIVAYGLAGESANAAAQIYAERFPRRARHPTSRQIFLAVQQLRETACLVHNRGAAGSSVRRRVRDEEILQTVYENSESGTSVRRVACDLADLGVSRYAVHHVLRVNELHSHHYQRMKQLLPGDEQQRVYFCEGFLAQCRRNVYFPDLILWTDVAMFTPNGVFNAHNFLSWAEENPHVVREGAFQCR